MQQLEIVVKHAKLLGKVADVARYSALLAPLPKAFNAHFFNATTAMYGEPGVCCQFASLYKLCRLVAQRSTIVVIWEIMSKATEFSSFSGSFGLHSSMLGLTYAIRSSMSSAALASDHNLAGAHARGGAGAADGPSGAIARGRRCSPRVRHLTLHEESSTFGLIGP
jgi:hypothetical protein